MELNPPHNQEAGRVEPPTRSEEERFVAAHERNPPRRRFTLEVAQTSWATVITLGGELDVVCADAFKRRFAEATEDEPDHVVIDLRGLTFIDSTGLALLLRVNEMSQDGGFALSVVSGEDDPPSKIFRMTGTHTILPIVDELPSS